MRRVPHREVASKCQERVASASIQLRESVRHEGMHTKLHEYSLPTQIKDDKMVEKKEEDKWSNKQEAVVRNSIQRLTERTSRIVCPR